LLNGIAWTKKPLIRCTELEELAFVALLNQLKATYQKHDQSTVDHKWTDRWGGPTHQWHKTIFPRIRRFLPAKSILEIGCGRGIISQQLMHNATTLTLVDFVDIREQLLLPASALNSKVRFYQNDGMTLKVIADKSIDFAFSFFSLVDADHETMRSYIAELDRVLTDNGAAFIHHSNALPEPGIHVDAKLMEQVRMVRSDEINAKVINNISNAFDLEPRIQECVAWVPGSSLLDCFSTLVRPDNIEVNSIGQFDNLDFNDEVAYGISKLNTIYGSSISDG